MRYDLKRVYEWPLSLQLVLIAPLCALIFYLAYFLDYTSLNKDLITARTQENDLKQQLQLIFEQEAQLQQDVAQGSEFKIMLKEWQKKLITPAKLPDLLNEILKIGTVNGIKFDSLNPGDQTKDGIYFKVPIKIIAVGGYHQMANFVSQLVNMQTLMTIQNIIIGKINQVAGTKTLEQQTGATTNTLGLELTLEVYYLSGK